MALVDLWDYLDDDALELRGVRSTKHPDGKTYRVPSPDHKTGLRLTAMVNIGIQVASGADVDPDDAKRASMDDEQEREFLPQVLGSAYDEMVDDGVSWVRVQKIGRYALLYFTLGEEAAAASMRSAEGNPPAPNREARRAASKSLPASSASAKSTRPRGSTSGTTSARKRTPAA